jgi:glycine cleavage system H protein
VALAVVALPAIAIVGFVARGVVLAGVLLALGACLVGFTVSPAFRSWIQSWTEPEIAYSGLRLATGCAFHPAHTWARLERNEATVGADDMMQSTLGPVDGVDLPTVGTRVRQGEPFARLRHGERCLDLVSPVTGRVLSANRTLCEEPGRINAEPFGDGWIARIEGDAIKTERGRLVRGEEARAWFRREVDRLISRLLPDAAPALPDGGVLVGELHRHIDDTHWTRLAEEFFGTARS